MTRVSSHRRVLGRVLQRLRKQRGLSQQQLGNMVPCDRKQIGSWERGEHSPTYDMLTKLAEALDIPLAEIIRMVEEDMPKRK